MSEERNSQTVFRRVSSFDDHHSPFSSTHRFFFRAMFGASQFCRDVVDSEIKSREPIRIARKRILINFSFISTRSLWCFAPLIL